MLKVSQAQQRQLDTHQFSEMEDLKTQKVAISQRMSQRMKQWSQGRRLQDKGKQNAEEVLQSVIIFSAIGSQHVKYRVHCGVGFLAPRSTMQVARITAWRSRLDRTTCCGICPLLTRPRRTKQAKRPNQVIRRRRHLALQSRSAEKRAKRISPSTIKQANQVIRWRAQTRS